MKHNGHGTESDDEMMVVMAVGVRLLMVLRIMGTVMELMMLVVMLGMLVMLVMMMGCWRW